MIEIPESINLAVQLNQTLKNKTVASVLVMKDPHKFAFTYEDPALYPRYLMGKSFTEAKGFGSWVEMGFNNSVFMVSEGTRLYYTEDKSTLPKKHQMLIRFTDDTYLSASIQMYGAVICAEKDAYKEKYYLLSKGKPCVLSDAFDEAYFEKMAHDEAVRKKSVKGFLATEQRIPGLGNGVLQDILFNAKLHPKTKINTLNKEQVAALYKSIKETIEEMTLNGGRNTERDLFGKPCGYATRMSKQTLGLSCPNCGEPIEKANYMGGRIYFCPTCQQVKK